MTDRSYNQYCPIAHALDLVGDRWALIIIRDLLLGPKRFSDLREGLPGIGTNILTNRLKALEQAEIVQRRYLPPPAASAVYELTSYGQGLEVPLSALAQWGAQSLGHSKPTQIISRDSVLLTLRALIGALPSVDEPITLAVELVDQRFAEVVTLRLNRDPQQIVWGIADLPQVQIRLDVDTLFGLASGSLGWQQAIAEDALHISGEGEWVKRLQTYSSASDS